MKNAKDITKDIHGNIISIDLHDAKGFTREQKLFLMDALNAQRTILMSQDFRIRYDKLKGYISTGEHPREVRKRLLQGESNFDRMMDYDLDYFITLYDSKRRSTVGYTNMQTAKIYTSRAFYWKWMLQGEIYGVAGLSSHLFHEYHHTMNLYHYGGWKWWLKRKKDFTYNAGDLMRDMIVYVKTGKLVLTVVR